MANYSPVLEQVDDEYIVIDGTHRLYEAISRGETEIGALVVKCPHVDLPAEAVFHWSNIEILTQNKVRNEKYINYNPAKFRPIQAAFETGL